tara:strand:- start:336 stop:605 length:270 start_codon:yes stop_codon:yes gene_type:complete
MAKQKLSPEAAIAKARRDLRYANSRDREIKRADAQKKRRAAKKCGRNIDGKDYDHNTGKFTSVAHNRGGTQSENKPDGTKQEKKQSRRA